MRPWDVAVVPLGVGVEVDSVNNAAALCARLGLNVIVDDRLKQNLNDRLRTADFYGIPVRLIIGDKEKSAGMVQIRSRGLQEAPETVRLEDLAERLYKIGAVCH